MSNESEKNGLKKLTLYLLQKGKQPDDVLKDGYKELIRDHPNGDSRFKIMYGTKPGKVPEWIGAYEISNEEADTLTTARHYGLIFVRFKTEAKNVRESMELGNDDEIETEQISESQQKIVSDDVINHSQICERWMVVTHGCGRELLELNNMERGFGLLFTLNCVDLVTFTNTKSLTMSRQSNITDNRPKGAKINQFYMLELLKGMRGKEFEFEEKEKENGEVEVEKDEKNKEGKNVSTKKKRVKISMEGNDVLKIKFWDRKGVSIEELPDLFKTYYEKFQEDAYKERFPSIKKFLPVYDNIIIEELESKVVDSIRQHFQFKMPENADFLDLSYPWTETPVNCENVVFKNLKKGNSQTKACELSVENYLNQIRNNKAETQIFKTGKTEDILERFEKHQVHLIALNEGDETNGSEKKIKWSVKKCLIYDTVFQDKHYCLIDSSWYMIDSDYITKLTEHFDKKLLPSTLPPYMTNCNELAYNTFACKEKDYLLMDDVTTTIGDEDRNQFEFCDILTKEAKMYHVKKYGSTSTLGYVFCQAETTATFIQEDNEVYTKIHNTVCTKAKEYSKAINTVKFYPENSTFCIAVIANKTIQKTRPTIPCLLLFYNATQVIEKFGYKVAFEWINDEAPKKAPKKQKPIPGFFPPISSDLSNSASTITDSGISIPSSSVFPSTSSINVNPDHVNVSSTSRNNKRPVVSKNKKKQPKKKKKT